MQKIAITGATGFIGSSLVRKLIAQGHSVKALIEPNANTQNIDDLGDSLARVTVDVCDYDAMLGALQGCDTLYHLAAVYKTWMPDPSVIYRVNVEGTTTTLLAAQKANLSKVVYTSSIAAIGLREDGEPSDETVEFNLFGIANEYILTKHLSEKIALRFARSGLPLVVVNPGFPFGPRDTAPTPTGRIILQLLQGKIPGYTPGGFCAIDVDDVSEGHILAAQKGRIGERYILAHHNVTWKEFFTLVSEVAGVRRPFLPVPGVLAESFARILEGFSNHITHQEPLQTLKTVQYSNRKVFFDSSKAKQELGVPVTPLKESIERAVTFFRSAGMV